jgi:UDP-N-acetylmuramoyl-L-alanyl-D-glutamate--2,6-diaminopimelate ligase
MEDYFQAKRLLFVPAQGDASASDTRALGPVAPAVSVVNVGDVYGNRLAAELDRVVTFAVDVPADFSAMRLRCGFAGCSFTLQTRDGQREVELPMPGRFNVANALGALAAVHSLGFELDALVAALERGVRVPGRFEPVEEGQEFAVLVDYAHTPDSLENVLSAARDLVEDAGEGRVLCVFGAGGDRDRGKRPLMGEIAERLADVTIVTSDNPRSEDPEQIIEEILDGVVADPGEVGVSADAVALGKSGVRSGSQGQRVRAITDRRAAIEETIACARRGDVVVIAGKGHEQGQEFKGGLKLPFDDVMVAREALRTTYGSTARDQGVIAGDPATGLR